MQLIQDITTPSFRGHGRCFNAIAPEKRRFIRTRHSPRLISDIQRRPAHAAKAHQLHNRVRRSMALRRIMNKPLARSTPAVYRSRWFRWNQLIR